MTPGGFRRDEPLVFEITSGIGVKVVPLSGSRIDVGRSAENTIILDDPQVSRRHARLDRSEMPGWRVADLNSRNGTFVNGIRVGSRPVAFRVGDELLIGSSVIRVRMPERPTQSGDTVLKSEEDDCPLSPREASVLRLVAEGCTDQEVADRLIISVKTVHSHLESIRDKTGARRRSELTRAAIRLGLT